MGDWCTIESDPGVFTELIKEIGVKNVQVEEIFEIDGLKFNIENLDPVYGIIFLFKWKKELQLNRQTLDLYDQDLFFANQVIQNACATQAILSVLLNNNDLEIGDELNNLKSFSKELDPQTKGLVISNSEKIKKAHNSFNRPEPFIFSKEKPKDDKGQDVYHFVSYIPFKGKVYELDGLQKGPIMLGDAQNTQDWLSIVETEIKKRIQSFGDSETMFNLLAICQDISHKSNQKIQELNQNLQNVEDETVKQQINNEINYLQQTIKDEQYKLKRHQEENTRRKHNYIPLILNLLEIAAKKGKLEELVSNASQKSQQK